MKNAHKINKNAEIEKLSQTFATLQSEFNAVKTELKASDVNTVTVDKMYQAINCMMSSVYSMIDNCHARISKMDDYYYKMLSEHYQGHLPKLTPSQLNAVLKTCGADEDYEVAKRMIFASKNEITAEYIAPQKS